MNIVVILAFVIIINGGEETIASLGDSFPSYKSCVDTCRLEYCEKDGYYFKTPEKGYIWSGLLSWRCVDDCKYRCMWSIVDNFERKGWPPPQFHGKVCINCWMWSAIFHARDLPITELMDYLSAFGMVFYSLYGMIMRVLIGAPGALSVIFTLVCVSFFINHAGYLVLDQFDYEYNMTANIAVGILSAGVSAVWSLVSWRQLNHSKYLATVVVLGLLTTLLEVSDFPPYLWVFDAHALWHLSTVPIPYFFWKFVIEDCKHLRKTLKER